MLLIVQLEEIEKALMEISGHIDSLDRRDPRFPDLVKRWCSGLEKILENNRLPVSAEVAVLRGGVISAQRGILPEGMRHTGRISRRTVAEAAAADALRRAEEKVMEAISPDMELVREAGALCKQIVAMPQARELIQEYGNNISVLWAAIRACQELAGAAVRVEGLVGPSNAQIVLARSMESKTGF